MEAPENPAAQSGINKLVVGFQLSHSPEVGIWTFGFTSSDFGPLLGGGTPGGGSLVCLRPNHSITKWQVGFYHVHGKS